MYNINFDLPISIHFIGIGGISMSGLAELLHDKGFRITGSDMKTSLIIERLQKTGIEINIGHRSSNISDNIDLVVYTAAIQPSNIEYQTVLKKQIPIIDRAELLGQLMKNYKYPIAVAGTHGKTTTTSMLSHILLEAKTDPTLSIGGILDKINGSIKVGNSEFFLTEACEYCDSFLKFYPYIGIILNIEEDHLDYFKDIAHIQSSFINFAKKIPKNGYLVINTDIHDYKRILEEVPCQTITFGSDQSKAQFSYGNLKYDQKGNPSFDLFYQGNPIKSIQLSVNGTHNVLNALASIAAATALNIKWDAIIKGLESFIGTKRRFEYKGNLKGIHIVDDYAHHPTEIIATLQAAKNYPHNHLWVVFQPHTYTRTKAFLKDFANALTLADNIILTDIYAAREKNTGDIHTKDLVKELKKMKKEVYYFPSFDEIEIFLLQKCYPNDLLITMGAGDVKIIGEELLNG